MILKRKLAAEKRRGAVAVETAGILILLLSFVFGVFEFGRLFLDWNLLNNAARQGCRFAIVNITDTTISTDVQTVVTTAMAGQAANFSNLTVTVTGTHNGVTTAVNSLAAGDPVTVTVSGTFKFLNIIPIKKMPTNFTITSAVIMLCEGGI